MYLHPPRPTYLFDGCVWGACGHKRMGVTYGGEEYLCGWLRSVGVEPSPAEVQARNAEGEVH